MVLLSQITAFLQRATLPSHIISPEIKHRIRESQAFVQCCENVLAFQRAFPVTVENPVHQLSDGRLDANLVNAHVVPFV
jgi:hypothetical protein